METSFAQFGADGYGKKKSGNGRYRISQNERDLFQNSKKGRQNTGSV
jgi:hypothetical protein